MIHLMIHKSKFEFDHHLVFININKTKDTKDTTDTKDLIFSIVRYT